VPRRGLEHGGARVQPIISTGWSRQFERRVNRFALYWRVFGKREWRTRCKYVGVSKTELRELQTDV
jgi:hypothetical protein